MRQLLLSLVPPALMILALYKLVGVAGNAMWNGW